MKKLLTFLLIACSFSATAQTLTASQLTLSQRLYLAGKKVIGVTNYYGPGIESHPDSLMTAFAIRKLLLEGGVGDTTIFETVLDSTGQANNRVLFSRNRKIATNAKFLFDSANSKLGINVNNISQGGNGTKLVVGGGGATLLTGGLTVQNIPPTNDTIYKELVMGSDGVVRRRTYYLPTGSGGGSSAKAYAPLLIRNDSIYQRFNLLAYGGVGDNLTNNDSAYARCLRAIVDAGGGTMYIPKGVYIGQIVLPMIAYPAWMSIRIEGETVPDFIFGTVGSYIFPTTNGGTVLKSLATTGKGVISVTGTGFSSIAVSFKNLEVRTYDNPQINGVDLSQAIQIPEFYNVFINTGKYVKDESKPLYNVSGLITPADGNGALTYLANVVVSGYYNGIVINEHTYGEYITVAGNINGLNFKSGSHTSFFTRVGVYNNVNQIYVSGNHRFDILQLNTEFPDATALAAGASWQEKQFDLKDTAAVGKGMIIWATTKANVGVVSEFIKSGPTSYYDTRQIATGLLGSQSWKLAANSTDDLVLSDNANTKTPIHVSKTATLNTTSAIAINTNSDVSFVNGDFIWNAANKRLTFGNSTGSVWSGAHTGVIESGGAALMFGTIGDVYLLSNIYYNGGWKYKANGPGSDIFAYNGEVQLRTVLTGTAGAAASFGLALVAKNNRTIQFPAYTAGTATFDGSGNITSSSDRRIKNTIKDFKPGLAEILRLRPRTFRYNADSTNTDMSGFIAQEVQQVIPGAVHKGKDKDGTLSLETNAIIAALVNGMQEQQKQIEALKKEVQELKK